MQIVVTNDDGIHSEGLHILAEVLRTAGHDVWIAAPDTERSAFSHAITLRTPVQFHEIESRTYTCSGTPADCIFYGLKGAIPVTPDVVISGINKGYNVGTDIIYSGTAGAAREAALHQVPAIALSAEGFAPPFPFTEAAEFTAEHLEDLVALWTPDIFININVPASPIQGWEVSFPDRRTYGDSIEPYQARKHVIYYFLTTGNTTTDEFTPERCSDMDVVQRGRISVSPIQLHPAADTDQLIRFKGLHAKGSTGTRK
ncbi:MAG: 5'/3'-nucleotidase SurE [Spirochaetia bacterium]|nr:5'/3'-nucleotidase SurE [Spirochaetia bacterium]